MLVETQGFGQYGSSGLSHEDHSELRPAGQKRVHPMTSLLVHYQELTLKGATGPGSSTSCSQPARDDVGSGREGGAAAGGPHRDRAGPGRGRGGGVGPRRPHVRDCELLDRRARRTRTRRGDRVDFRQTEDLPAASFRVATTRATSLSHSLAGGRASRRAAVHQARGCPSGSITRAGPSRRDHPGPGLLLRREDACPGGLPTGVSAGSPACSPADRFAGRGLARHEARARALFVHFHSYPIVSRASQDKAAGWSNC